MTDDKKDDETPIPEWEYKTTFGINARMKEVLEKTLEAAKAERNVLLKKLRKAQYGK